MSTNKDTSVYLKVGQMTFGLPPSSSLVDFLDGMATDYRDACHRKMADAMGTYNDGNDVQHAAFLAAEGAKLQSLAESIEGVRDAVETKLDEEKS